MLGYRGFMRSRWASIGLVIVVAAALFGGNALTRSTPKAWSRQDRTVPGASSHSFSDRSRALSPMADRALRLQMQHFLATHDPLASARPARTIDRLPMPSLGEGSCYVGSGSCSLVPCVEPVGTSALAQLNLSASSATTCSRPSTSQRVVAVMNPTTGAVVSITGAPATVVMNPRTGAVLSITPNKR